MTQILISDIHKKKRIRKDIGDISSLTNSINDLGLLHPIVITKQFQLVAGSRRLKAVKKLGWKKVPVNIINIKNIRSGELDENRERKNFTLSEIREISDYVEKNTSRGAPNKGGKSPPLFTGKVRDNVSKITGIGQRKVNKIIELVDASKNNTYTVELLNKVDSGKISLEKAHHILQKQKKREKLQKKIEKLQVKLPKTIQLYNKKFQDVKIVKNSVSLIFTDPPYHDEFLYLYKDLAKQTIEILRENGSLLCYVGQHNIGKIINIMKKVGLKFHWIITVINSGQSVSLAGKKILSCGKILLWFTKGKYHGDFVRDIIKSEYQGNELHPWAKSTVESDYYIKHMTIPNEIVYDPFMGSGVFGMSAKKLKRQFIGCEVDKKHYNTARRLISNAE